MVHACLKGDIKSSGHSPCPSKSETQALINLKKWQLSFCIFFFDISIPLALLYTQRKTTTFRKQGSRKRVAVSKENIPLPGKLNQTFFLNPPKKSPKLGSVFHFIFSILRKSGDEGRRQAHDPFSVQQSYPGQKPANTATRLGIF